MSRRPSAAARKDGPLLESWRQPKPSWQLPAQRLAFTLLLLGLLAAMVYLAFSFLLKSRTYFYFLPARVGASVETPIGASVTLPPLAYVHEDFAEYVPLAGALAPIEGGENPKKLLFGAFASRAAVEQQLESLARAPLDSGGAVIVCVTAHGLVTDQGPVLACSSYDPAERPAEVVPVRDVLDRLAATPGKTKLLILDAGRAPGVARVGTVTNGFPDRLAEEVAEANHPGVYVLTANSAGERSRVSPSRRRSVFACVTAAGLRGLADRPAGKVDLDGKGDGAVDLAELTSFVRGNVAEWVARATNNKRTQTPQLLGADANRVEVDRPHLLYCDRVEPPNALATAASASGSTSVVKLTLDFVSARVSEFGVRQFTELSDKLNNAFTGGGADEAEEADGAAATDASRQAVAQQASALYESAWRLTEQVAEEDRPPAEYAPHLWRLHLDRLAWLGQLRGSGEMTEEVKTAIANQVGAIKRSLEEYREGVAAPSRAGTVFDRIRQIRPTLPLDPTRAPTLALADRLVAENPDATFSPGRQEFINAFWEWAEPDNPAGVAAIEADAWQKQDWGGQTWEQVQRAYYEWALLDDFRGQEPPLPLLKAALQARRLAGEATAHPAWGQGWVVELIEKADAQRLEAERLLRTRAAGDWRGRVKSNLAAARGGYLRAIEQLARVRRAEQLYARTAVELRDFLRWAPLRAESSSTALDDLLTQWRAVGQRLKPLASRDISELDSAMDQLSAQRVRLLEELREAARGAGGPGSLQAAEVLGVIYNPLVAIELRAPLADRLAQLERASLDGLELATRAAPSRPQNGPEIRLPLEWAVYSATPPPGRRGIEPPAADDRPGLVAASVELSERLAELPDSLASSAAALEDLREPIQRPARIEELDRIARALPLLDASGAGGAALATAADLAPRWLYEARWHDLLAAHQQRLAALRDDAAPAETVRLQSAASRIGRMAEELSREAKQPVLAPFPQPLLEVSLDRPTASVQLTDTDTVRLTVRSTADSDTDVWLVSQHDAGLVDVTCATHPIVAEERVRRLLSRAGAGVNTRYPYRPAPVLAPSLTLEPGAEATFAVTIRRQNPAGADTTIALKAIGGSGGYARAELPVAMPGDRDIDLLVSSGGPAAASGAGRTLLYPNRPHPLTLQLKNSGAAVKKLLARVYAPGNRPDPTLFQPGAVDLETVRQRLSTLGALGEARRIGSSGLITVAPGEAEKLLLQLQNPTLSAKPGPKDPPPSLRLGYGLVVAIAEFDAEQPDGVDFQSASEYRLRWVDFDVVEPQEYVRARAVYDTAARQLRVAIEPKGPGAELPGVVGVRLSVPAGFLAKDRVQSVVNSLGPDRPRCEVLVSLRDPFNWPADSFVAEVEVDRYPRAFTVPMQRGQSRFNRPLEENKPGVRLLAPLPVPPSLAIERKAYRGGEGEPKTIDAVVAADTPPGFFQVEGRRLLVGVDTRNLRDLRDDSPEQRYSDRSVAIAAQPPGDSPATLVVATEVSDFTIPLSIEGLQGSDFQVMTRLEAEGGNAYEDYHQLVLDGDDPEISAISKVRFPPPDTFVLEFRVTDASTSVAKVEGRIEKQNGELGKWQPASRVGQRWRVELKTGDLNAGAHSVELRAEDAVGNPGVERLAGAINVASKPMDSPRESPKETAKKPPPPPPKAKFNRVSGRLQKANGSIKGISSPEVKLVGEKTIDGVVAADFSFVFPRVPPGKYQLQAKATVNGYPRKASAAVEVSDKPKSPKNLGALTLERL